MKKKKETERTDAKFCDMLDQGKNEATEDQTYMRHASKNSLLSRRGDSNVSNLLRFNRV